MTSVAAIRILFETTEKIEGHEDKELIDAFIQVEEEHSKDSEMLNRIGYVLQKRMEERQATAIPHGTHDVTFESTSVTYDQAALTPILELIDEQVAIDEGAYFKEWVEQMTRPARWDIRKTRKLKQYVPEINAIVDRAKRPTRPSLKITPKAPK